MTDEKYLRAKWSLPRIVKLHPDSDGLTRVITLRISTSTFKQPIPKKCMLPIDSDRNNSTILLPKTGNTLENRINDCTSSPS